MNDIKMSEEMSTEELIELLNTIKDTLTSAEDAGEFCLWLADQLDINVRSRRP